MELNVIKLNTNDLYACDLRDGTGKTIYTIYCGEDGKAWNIATNYNRGHGWSKFIDSEELDYEDLIGETSETGETVFADCFNVEFEAYAINTGSDKLIIVYDFEYDRTCSVLVDRKTNLVTILIGNDNNNVNNNALMFTQYFLEHDLKEEAK